MMRRRRVAIAGFGRVGRSIASMLLARRPRYLSAYGIDVRLVAVCGSRAGLSDPTGLEMHRFDRLVDGNTGPDFLAREDFDVLFEAGPTDVWSGQPGLSYIESSLAAGRHCIVISKGALVRSGPRLRDLASTTGVALEVSGAAAAALPALDVLKHSTTGSEVLRLEGVLNATCNHVLGEMYQSGTSLEAALWSAQGSGSVEADPRNDLEGWDTACKLVILANHGLGARLSIGDLEVDGIDRISQDQLADWRDRELVPKLVGELAREGTRLTGRVSVKPLPREDTLARVPNDSKALRIVTDAMGEIVLVGGGREPIATAAAALKDFENLLRR